MSFLQQYVREVIGVHIDDQSDIHIDKQNKNVKYKISF